MKAWTKALTRTVSFGFLVVASGVAGCVVSGAESSTTAPANSTSARSSGVAVDRLEGRWDTGAIPIADIKASMIAQGLTPREVGEWVKETGSPTQFAFELNFSGGSFTHSEETPQMAMQVGESGTFVYSGTRLIVSVGGAGINDTYTFAVKRAGDELRLQYLESTEQGTDADKAKHRVYAFAFYCSSAFRQQP